MMHSTPELRIGVPLPTKASLEAREKVFQQSEKIIQGLVKSGKVSEKDAEKRLIEMRKAMFPETNAKAYGVDPKANEKAE
ncbi:MAG: hypothetical protein GY904_24025 [Planctomycetaceae bacterium]|nr:hypothetical protein [Planctomycetaceae bacterium]